MMPFFLALEANDLGHVLDLFLALLVVVLDLGRTIGLLLVIGVKSKSTLVIGGFLHTQDIVECGLPFMTLFQVLLQRRDLGLVLFSLPWLVTTQVLEEVEVSLLEQQVRESNSSQDLAIL